MLIVSMIINRSYEQHCKLLQGTPHALALYEITRGVWGVSEQDKEAVYAMAIYHRKVVEIYRIDKWYPAGTQVYKVRPRKEIEISDRWEFSGEVAKGSIREYIGEQISRSRGRAIRSFDLDNFPR